MVINYLNLKCIAILKAKAYSPSVIDAEAELPKTIMLENFKMVRRRQSQILNASGRVKLYQPHRRSFKNIRRKAARSPGCVKAFRFIIRKGTNHKWIINRMFTCVNEARKSAPFHSLTCFQNHISPLKLTRSGKPLPCSNSGAAASRERGNNFARAQLRLFWGCHRRRRHTG
jgi:hypothetical protein